MKEVLAKTEPHDRTPASPNGSGVHAEVGTADVVPARRILGMRVDATSYADAAARIMEWASTGQSRYVCAASVNNVMQAHDAAPFQRLMNDADLVTPDGMPLVWALRVLGARDAPRVRGTNLLEALCDHAAAAGVPVGFYGGTPEALRDLLATIDRRWPDLHVVYAWSPPFRALSDEEADAVLADIVSSQVRLLFIGLPTPKQDIWMARHKGTVPAVMVGVGAAFDFLSGRKKQAPLWMQRGGLEWLFRLLTEPRRLWRRYLSQNPRFCALFAIQLLRHTSSTWIDRWRQDHRHAEEVGK